MLNRQRLKITHHLKGVEFDPLLAEAGSNSFTMNPTRWVDEIDA